MSPLAYIGVKAVGLAAFAAVALVLLGVTAPLLALGLACLDRDRLSASP